MNVSAVTNKVAAAALLRISRKRPYWEIEKYGIP
jgi:hypothetical protein